MNQSNFKVNPHSAAFWSWNGKLEKKEILRQIERFHQMGMGGFFMHSRTGLETPYLSDDWFELIRFCQEEAEKRGMKAWLYDEDRYPSGPVGGKLPREYPECRMKLIFLWEESGKLPPAPGKKIGKPFRRKDGTRCFFTLDEMPPWSWYNDQPFIDGMNPLTAQKFLEYTQEKYLANCPKPFPGVFTDEPNYGSVCTKMDWQENCQWCTTPYDERIRAIIKKQYGYDLFDHLPELFGLIRSHRFSTVQMHYVRVMTRLFTQNFIKPLGDWHRKHHMLFTGHVVGEDSLLMQTNGYGDVMQAYPHFGMPGIDVLCDDAWNRLPPVMVRSVARQYGKKECLAEVYGATGWDFPAEAHKNLGDRLLMDGIAFRCHHKADYTLKNEAKRDYPPSISYQLEWCKDYRVIEDYFRNLCSHLAGADRPAEILMLSPVESAWGHFGDSGWGQYGVTMPPEAVKLDSSFSRLQQDLHRRQLAFDLGSEELLAADGRVADGKFFLKRIGYKAVVVPQMETMRVTTRKLLEAFSAAGGLVIAPFGLPKLEEGYPRTEAFRLAVRKSLRPLDVFKRIRFSLPDATVFGAVFTQKREEMLFVYNAAAEWNSGNDDAPWGMPYTPNCRNTYPEIAVDWLTDARGVPCEYDAAEDACREVRCEAIRGGWRIHTSFDRLQSRLFLMKKRPVLASAKQEQAPELPLPKAVKYRLEEDNILLLDHFTCPGIADKPCYILELDTKLRASLNLPQHSGFIVQPWAETRHRTEKTPFRETVLRTVFRSTQEFPAELVIENPDLFEVYLNGKKLSPAKPARWWFDISFCCMEIPAGVMVAGENTLELRTRYDEFHPGVEAVFLRGRFAADADSIAICPLPETLPIGKDWTKCGLPFYQGAVTCMIPAQKLAGLYRLPRFAGVIAYAVCGQGERQVLAFPPYNLAVPEKSADIELTLASSPRNFLGPFFYDYPVYVSAPHLFWQNNVKKRIMGKFGWKLGKN